MKSFWTIVDMLKKGAFIDLTHSFHSGIPHAADMPDEHTKQIYALEKDGFEAHLYTHVGQWGTHVDPPGHYVKGGRSVDQISLEEMLLPLVVFDCAHLAQANPDYILTMDFVRAWETANGEVPRHSFVAMRTDWSSRWPSQERMFNRDGSGIAHFPGWGRTVVEFLITERDVSAFGHETTDTDGGIAISNSDYTVESLLLHSDRYQIELLNNLVSVPAVGALVIATFPKPRGGSGFPARVFAICPRK